jgi:hypothetical protein
LGHGGQRLALPIRSDDHQEFSTGDGVHEGLAASLAVSRAQKFAKRLFRDFHGSRVTGLRKLSMDKCQGVNARAGIPRPAGKSFHERIAWVSRSIPSPLGRAS